ncbi:hypothetical protein M6B38_116950 [Iris pallida]|uniref:Uncharacterized protein n=1 Tax=Iris pallida TaxID=29817 RepID=A0AAX6GZE1_IRIPA|nr:hypothetical protein M6B38_173220 [Iris pallida]KAJ6834066.1 hypothetical protein M6B38_337595 [Iris pallida]KAJ6843788.1 hypothetical protein M6B38_116950 [Iris pallida]
MLRYEDLNVQIHDVKVITNLAANGRNFIRPFFCPPTSILILSKPMCFLLSNSIAAVANCSGKQYMTILDCRQYQVQ